MRMPCTIAAALLLAGCATKAHLRLDAKLTPLGNAEFSYVAIADATAPEDSPRYEAMRLEILSEKMNAGGFCASGHEIVERRAALEVEGLLGKAHTIYYRVRCRS